MPAIKGKSTPAADQIHQPFPLNGTEKNSGTCALAK